MKILVIGNGAREHALVWKIAQSPKVTKIYVAPGNAGTATIASNLNIRPTDVETLGNTVKELGIDLTFVGPEIPLAAGIVDHFEEKHLPIIGPKRKAALLESSKVFARRLMDKYKIPCSQGNTFTEHSEAREYVSSQQFPVVIKADGLAAGKGVIIANSREEAIKALNDIMTAKIFGTAGEQVVIEEYLQGQEVSLLAFTDGETVIPMIPACDYKRALDNDQGPNTGGMGSYSPPNFFNAELTNQVKKTVIEPIVKGLAKEGTPYKGILYTGLMITSEGPKVLEFNARFGDPETQVILPRLNSDLLDIFLALHDGRLNKIDITWNSNVCVGVVMASGGYPDKYETGFPIDGLDNVSHDIMVFHAGTKEGEHSQTVTDGGRVLTVAAMGNTIADARNKVYSNLPLIKFDGCFYRKDIAAREVN
ncbi:phosphoribosylamine--glycine ligase [Chloroflexota bacterium]